MESKISDVTGAFRLCYTCLWFLKIKLLLILILNFRVSWCNAPLGSHTQPSAGAATLAGMFVPPGVLYFHFVKTGTPLLMKGVLQEKYPDFTKFTDEYIRDRYGDEVVHVEMGKKEDRSRSSGTQLLSEFLDTYGDSDVYMVHSVPASMKDDVLVPPSLQCGGFQQSLQDSVIWLSSGGTRSLLHNDDLDNILCVFDGVKEFVLFDKKYNEIIEADGFVKEGSYSLVDVDDVDKKRFPGVAMSPWNQVTVKAGDCLFVPQGWFHHVNSLPGRNLAVNFWFSHLWWFNKTDCVNGGRNIPPAPLSDFSVGSQYEQMRSDFLSSFEDLDEVSRQEFRKQSTCETTQEMWKFWEFINGDGNADILSWSELYSFDVSEALPLYRQCLVGTQTLENADNDAIEGDKLGTSFEEMMEDLATGKAVEDDIDGTSTKEVGEDVANGNAVDVDIDDTSTADINEVVMDVEESEEGKIGDRNDRDKGEIGEKPKDEDKGLDGVESLENDQNAKNLAGEHVDIDGSEADSDEAKVHDDKFKRERSDGDKKHTHDEF